METPDLSSLDWEALCLVIRCEQRTWTDANDIQQRLLLWFEQRDKWKDCACELTFLHVNEVEQASFELRCEWLCKKCIYRLFDYFDAEFRRVKSIEVLRPEFTIAQVDQSTIRVGKSEIELEDGTTQIVDEFEISRMPTSRQQFLDFVDETGYVTNAERFGDGDTFRENDVMLHLTKNELEQVPVNCVTYLDAVEYCKYAGVRLPSEAEWLSASLITDELLDRKEYGNRFCAPVEENPRKLEWLSSEITGTLQEDGKTVVIRRGPRWARTTDWREQVVSHRFLAPPDAYDIMTGFRVVVSG